MDCRLFLWQIKDSRSSRERLYHCATGAMADWGISGPLPPLLREEGGKPYFEGRPFHFSLSHSGGWWACAFGRSPLGLDIQQMDTTRDRQAIARRFFHPDEAAYLSAGGPEDFYAVWCAKEAWVKYTGEGISGLRGFSVVGEGGIQASVKGVPLVFPAPPQGYMLALCGCGEAQLKIICK